jgi:ubiquinone/menaquinone biosynthesis C-methylase UbiE
MPTFDGFAEKYDGWFETPLGRYVAAAEKRLVLDLAAPVRGEKMIDIGIGTGFFTIDFLKRGLDITGIDISGEMIAVAQKKGFKNLSLADACHIPYPDEAFTLVLSVTALEFIKEPERAVSEMTRVCKKGGRIVVGTLGAHSLWALKRNRDVKNSPDSVFHDAHFYTLSELKELALKFSKRVSVNGAVFAPPYDNALSILTGKIIERPCQDLCPCLGAFLTFRIDKE